MVDDPTRLPIADILVQLCDALAGGSAAIVVAPPGAGKTTVLPLVLLDADWAAGRKLILLEPRRLAARAAAQRMAESLGQAVGETVGLRIRLETRSGRSTRLEVVTEGVFSRMIVDDPELKGVAAVLFDEFHERSLDADLGLALALETQAALRPDLRLVVMSATLEVAKVRTVLPMAPVIESRGRAYPVATRYLGRAQGRSLEDDVAQAIVRGLREESGSVLAFLPGRAEIDRTGRLLDERLRGEAVVAPLHGSLDRAAQDAAIRPPREGARKVVLATSIAETSLTIEGVRIVVDSGLARVPRFEPGLGLARLETIRESRASADQRRGRAGRTEPGVCYRLWDKEATGSLAAHALPEIAAADLSGLALELAAWGARDPAALRWIDPPPSAAFAEARALLVALGALDSSGELTELGRTMRALPMPPRLARMAIEAAARGCERLACLAAVALGERIHASSVNLADRLRQIETGRDPRSREARRLAHAWAQIARKGAAGLRETGGPLGLGALVAVAYPDRVAKARGAPGAFLMANGRAGGLDAGEPLAQSQWLAIAELSGPAGAQRIMAAASIERDEIEAAFASRAVTKVECAFDARTASVRARTVRRLGAIVLSEGTLPAPSGLETARLLARGAAAMGVRKLPWTPQQISVLDRAAYRRCVDGGDVWPDLSEAALADAIEDWLAPHILERVSLGAISSSDLAQALAGLLDGRLMRRLESETPAQFRTPAGSLIDISYSGDGAPRVEARVQEFYGLREHPKVAGTPLTLVLLSPAGRPIQITRDLPTFWSGSWTDVRKDMRARYPKHAWPEDPATAAPTLRAKSRAAPPAAKNVARR